MKEQTFEVLGEYRERDAWKPFTKIVSAANENGAQERIFSIIGSKHHLKRNYIRINSVTPASGE